MFTQRDIATGQLIRKLNSLGGGSSGGTNGAVVVEYDANDPANQIAEQFTLADFEPVDESAIIVGNTFKPNSDSSKWLNTTVGIPYPQDIQYCAIKLNNVPTSGSISIDYSNHDDYCIALVTMSSAQELTLQYIVENYLFQGFSTNYNRPSFDMNITKNIKDDSFSALQFKWALLPPEASNGQREAQTNTFNFSDTTNPIVFDYKKALDVIMLKLGVTTLEELIQYAKDNGFYSEDFLASLDLYAKQPILFNEAMLINNDNNFLPKKGTETYLILCPIYDNYWDANRDPLLLDAEWVANVEVNVTKVTSWKVPELTGDTFLKINGSCELLGYSLTTGDTLYVYENGTKALKFKG